MQDINRTLMFADKKSVVICVLIPIIIGIGSVSSVFYLKKNNDSQIKLLA